MGRVLELMTLVVEPMVVSGVEVQFNGKVLQCHICNSTKHFIKHCRHREELDEVNLNVQITVEFKARSEVGKSSLEGLGRKLPGTGCSKTVAGHTWLKEF